MPRKPEDPDESLDPYDEADDYGPDLIPDMGGVTLGDGIIWDDERKPSKRGKRGMPEDQEPREFPKVIIYAIIGLVIVLPAGVFLYDALNSGMQPSYSTMGGASSDLYEAWIQKGESNRLTAAAYHDAALINFSRGQYDLAIDQMTLAAGYSLQSTSDYLAAVRETPQDYGGANLSSEGALYMHEAEMRYIEAFKCYRSGDMANASIYWDEAKYYVRLSADHQVSH